MKKALKFLSIALILSSCSPTVRLDTPEPVKIDVNMKVDVTTEAKQSNAKVKTQSSSQKSSGAGPLQRRRLRMAEIQDLKNNRIIGEANDGLLSIRQLPDDSTWAEYTRKLVREENRDRRDIFEQEAQETGKPAEIIAKEFARRMRQASFPNEWVQTEQGEWKKN